MTNTNNTQNQQNTQQQPPQKVDYRQQISTQLLQEELGGRLFKTTSLAFEFSKYVIALITVVLTLHSLIATVSIISGPSMLPTFTSGSHVLVDRRDWVPLNRNDNVILRYPGDPQNRLFIKRIVGIPGDKIEIHNSTVYVNDSPIREDYLAAGITTAPDITPLFLGEDEYYTLGDNRPVSNDSRFFGPVERKFMVGKVLTTLYAAEIITN